MDHVSEIEQVRRVVIETLPELGVDESDSSSVRETVLLRDAKHAGRRFLCERVRAVWFIDSPQIDFFSQDGVFLKAVSFADASRADNARPAAA